MKFENGMEVKQKELGSNAWAALNELLLFRKEIVMYENKEDTDLNTETSSLMRARQICADLKMVGEFVEGSQ